MMDFSKISLPPREGEEGAPEDAKMLSKEAIPENVNRFAGIGKLLQGESNTSHAGESDSQEVSGASEEDAMWVEDEVAGEETEVLTHGEALEEDVSTNANAIESTITDASLGLQAARTFGAYQIDESSSDDEAAYEGEDYGDTYDSYADEEYYDDDALPEDDVANPLLDEEDDEDVVTFEEATPAAGFGRGDDRHDVTINSPLAFQRSVTGENDFAADDSEEAEPFVGFDEQLEELLEEEEAPVAPPVEEATLTSIGASEAPSLQAQVLAEAERRVVDNTKPKRFFPEGIKPEFDKKAADWQEQARVREAKAAARQELIQAKTKDKPFESDFYKKPTAVVTTDEEGLLSSERGKRGVKSPAPTVKGKLHKAEMEFFRNAGVRKQAFVKGYHTSELEAGPLARIEDEQQRRERRERLEKLFAARNDFKAGSKFALNVKMIEMLAFLSLFRYATHRHISRMFGEAERTTRDRLYSLRSAGLVVNKKIYAQADIWYLTEAGKLVSGYDLPRVTEGRLTYSMFPHQFTVNHVAANLWGGKLNVLNMDDFPSKNRVNMQGKQVLGEELTSELEILSSFSKMKLFDNSASYRPRLMGELDHAFDLWLRSEDRANTPSPEMVYGNEWMWTLLPPAGNGVAHHVPDLVVKRPRQEDGTPTSIAVEIEISTKVLASYERTLRAYESDKRIYGKVVWVCRSIGPAKRLEAVGRKLGMIQDGRLVIVPIWTEAGVFKARDLWTI